MNKTENLWIVKPGCMSRGWGIAVFKDYNEIIEHMK